MERRLMKDFQIGFVEGVVNEALATTDKDSKDVFSKIAKAIGKRGGTTKGPSNASKKEKVKDKDWNSKVRQSVMRRDPIGSSAELQGKYNSRQSLRRYILEHGAENVHQMDAGKLAELNPNLEGVSPATRVAYAKFKMRKIRFEEVNITHYFKLWNINCNCIFHFQQTKLPQVGEVNEKDVTKTEVTKSTVSLKKIPMSSVKVKSRNWRELIIIITN